MAIVYLYDEIGAFGISAADFAQELKRIPVAEEITVRINSPGGDAFDGLAIYNLLIRRAGRVTVSIDGMAASAASIVAMAGEQIVMASNAFIMVHSPWLVIGGTATDLREAAGVLDQVERAMVDTYATRRRIPRETVQGWVSAETVFSAQEAVDVHLVDAVDAELVAASRAEQPVAVAASADENLARLHAARKRQVELLRLRSA